MTNEEEITLKLDQGYSTPICLKLIAILLARLIDKIGGEEKK